MEVLNLYVPGFFHTEHQDESILAFRGIAPDNNSKVLLLLNGHNLNTEWFLGASDGILQSLDMEYIERIDVIRGPGSVTMGQGALLGVINITTTKSGYDKSTTVTGGMGKNGYAYTAFGSSIQSGDLLGYFHVSANRYDGQAFRPEGNVTRAWEGVLGGTLYASGQRLLRSQGLTALGSLSYQDFELQFLHNDRQRDLPNFFRDRGQYQQILDSLSLAYNYRFAPDHKLKFKADFDQDDTLLHSNLGYTMGGTREYRHTHALLYTGCFGDFSMAAGLEDKRYKMGQANRDGNNFIAQKADASLLNNPNLNNVMVYPADLEVKSVFMEAYYTLYNRWDFFAALRYDKHPFWGSNTTPRMGAIYSPSSQWRFRLSYQTGFRGAPGMHYAGAYEGDGLLREENFDKVNSATGGHVQNIPKVQPEKMKSWEFETHFAPVGNLQMGLVLFRNQMDHIITFNYFWTDQPWLPASVGTDKVGDWGGCWWFVNTNGNITTQGAELSVRYSHPVVDVNFSHSLVRLASVDANIYTIATQYLADRSQGKHFGTYPEDVTRLNLVFFPQKPWKGSLNILRYGDWYAPSETSAYAKSPGQLLVNAALDARIYGGFSLNLSVNNLFNSTKLYPFDDRAKGTDFHPGAPLVEERTWWIKFMYRF